MGSLHLCGKFLFLAMRALEEGQELLADDVDGYFITDSQRRNSHSLTVLLLCGRARAGTFATLARSSIVLRGENGSARRDWSKNSRKLIVGCDALYW
jgi:hypothetical protein